MDNFKSDFPHVRSLSSPIHPQLMNDAEWRDGQIVNAKEITATDFIKKLSVKDGNQSLGDLSTITRVKGAVEITPETYSLKNLVLLNFEFLDIVVFSGIDQTRLNIGNRIILKNCVFLKPLQFINCTSSDTVISEFHQGNEAIQIINGSYILLRIDSCALPFGVKMFSEEGQKLEIDWFESGFNHFLKCGYDFENVTFKSKLDLTGDIIENVGIYFRNCSIK